MKKNLFILVMIFCANLIFAQTATISVGTINDPIVGEVYDIPVYMDEIDWPEGTPVPELISGFALFFYFDATALELEFPTFPADFSVTWDPYWSGSYVANNIEEAPMPGYNTIALVYGTGGVQYGADNQKIADVRLKYLGGGTDLIWDEGLLNTSYIIDYNNISYDITFISGCVCLSGYDITFQVEDDNGSPLQDASITIGTETIATNASGEAVFNRPDGDYDYTITKNGYYDFSGDVTVAGAAQTVPISMFPLGSQFDVTFHVTDGTNNLEGALVTVGTQSLNTDMNEEVIFSLPNGNFDYEVSKYGYSSANGNFDVTSIAQDIDVQLTMLPHYDITFHVTSDGNNIEGATVAIPEVGTMGTDVDGNAVFSLIDGDYDYTITKEGFETKTGMSTVAGAINTIEETLLPLYVVTFQVTSEGENLEGVMITVGAESVSTDSNGMAEFHLTNGNYDYTATLFGYNDEAGSFVVADENVTVDVMMSVIEYLVTFHVTAEGNDLEGVDVSLDNGESAVTDVNGTAIFSLASGDYVYTATLDGYGTLQNLFTVFGEPTQVDVEMIPLPTYTATFHVTSEGVNLEGAEISIGDETIMTDADGMAAIDLINGPYTYSVTKLGYDTQEGTFTVINAPLSIEVDMLLTQWSITFHVTSDGTDIIGALVTVYPDSLTAPTGATGNATFNLINGLYTYTVDKSGYNTVTGDLEVNNDNQTIEIELTLFAWEVKFHIVSTGGALEGVNMTCNGQTEVTNEIGNAYFYLINGTYDYSGEKPGYIPLYGSITVNEANVTKNIIMFPAWDVTFTVTNNGNPIEGAIVSLEGEDDQVTPANGTVVFQKGNGTYDWTVSHEGFGSVSDQVTVDDASITVPVMLVGINDITSSSFSLNPNPSNDGIFNLTTTAISDINSNITVFDLAGKIVYSSKLVGNDVNVIDLSNQDTGMYIMQIIVEDQVFNKRLVIQ